MRRREEADALKSRRHQRVSRAAVTSNSPSGVSVSLFLRGDPSGGDQRRQDFSSGRSLAASCQQTPELSSSSSSSSSSEAACAATMSVAGLKKQFHKATQVRPHPLTLTCEGGGGEERGGGGWAAGIHGNLCSLKSNVSRCCSVAHLSDAEMCCSAAPPLIPSSLRPLPLFLPFLFHT